MLKTHYARIEAETSAFSRETGISCPRGCGECCTKIDFLVSRPEADEVAAFLVAHPPLLERFLSQPISGEKGPCPLYDAENAGAHCTVYPARPLLCRTFAFAAHREKTGRTVYAPCHKFRDDPALASRVEAVRTNHPTLPILPDDSLTIWSLDPAGNPKPMGPAVRDAVEALLLRRSLERG